MYVQDWKKGEWVYFPSQGLRTAGGRPWRNGMCGNYHTSSASEGGRVNIFHLHTPGELDPFEPSYGYSRRAVEAIDLDRIRMKGYGFQIEMKYTAWRLGLTLREESIIFVDRREGTSKMSGGIFGEAFFGVMKLPFRKIRPRTR